MQGGGGEGGEARGETASQRASSGLLEGPGQNVAQNQQHPEWMVDMAEKARKQLQAVEERLSVLRDVELKLVKATTVKTKEHEVNHRPLTLHLNQVEHEEQKANCSTWDFPKP